MSTQLQIDRFSMVQNVTATQHYKPLPPSCSNEDIWDWFGNNGTFCENAQLFTSLFDVFVHKHGVLFAKLKPRAEIKEITAPNAGNGLFSGTVLQDNNDCFRTKKIVSYITHYYDSDENCWKWQENIEASDSVSPEKLQKYMNSPESLIKDYHTEEEMTFI